MKKECCILEEGPVLLCTNRNGFTHLEETVKRTCFEFGQGLKSSDERVDKTTNRSTLFISSIGKVNLGKPLGKVDRGHTELVWVFQGSFDAMSKRVHFWRWSCREVNLLLFCMSNGVTFASLKKLMIDTEAF